MLDFPRRMRDWLFNIMRDMAERSELTPHYLSMEREAETNLTRRWTNAAIWKWCDLDAHDNDRSARNTALGLTCSCQPSCTNRRSIDTYSPLRNFFDRGGTHTEH